MVYLFFVKLKYLFYVYEQRKVINFLVNHKIHSHSPIDILDFEEFKILVDIDFQYWKELWKERMKKWIV